MIYYLLVGTYYIFNIVIFLVIHMVKTNKGDRVINSNNLVNSTRNNMVFNSVYKIGSKFINNDIYRPLLTPSPTPSNTNTDMDEPDIFEMRYNNNII